MWYDFWHRDHYLFIPIEANNMEKKKQTKKTVWVFCRSWQKKKRKKMRGCFTGRETHHIPYNIIFSSLGKYSLIFIFRLTNILWSYFSSRQIFIDHCFSSNKYLLLIIFRFDKYSLIIIRLLRNIRWSLFFVSTNIPWSIFFVSWQIFVDHYYSPLNKYSLMIIFRLDKYSLTIIFHLTNIRWSLFLVSWQIFVDQYFSSLDRYLLIIISRLLTKSLMPWFC